MLVMPTQVEQCVSHPPSHSFNSRVLNVHGGPDTAGERQPQEGQARSLPQGTLMRGSVRGTRVITGGQLYLVISVGRNSCDLQ